jgi:hypothetical protein
MSKNYAEGLCTACGTEPRAEHALPEPQRWRMTSTGLEPHPEGEWVRYQGDPSPIKPGDVINLGGRSVRVWQGTKLLRDHRGRIAVRSVDGDRLSYVPEHRLIAALTGGTSHE